MVQSLQPRTVAIAFGEASFHTIKLISRFSYDGDDLKNCAPCRSLPHQAQSRIRCLKLARLSLSSLFFTMSRALIVAAFLGCVLATAHASSPATWYDCTKNGMATVKSVAINPNPPAVGVNTTVVGTGTLTGTVRHL